MFGAGYEAGGQELILDSAKVGGFPERTTISASNPHTGSYSVKFGDDSGWITSISGTQGEIYVGFWVDPATSYDWDLNKSMKIGFVLNSGSRFEVTYNIDTSTLDLIDGSAEAGTIIWDEGNYNNVQIHFVVGAAGSITTKINGMTDIEYIGDTRLGGGSYITGLRFYHEGPNNNHYDYVDDLVIGDDGWPGDIQFERLLAVGDTPTEDWDLSAGADSYALVDEVPPDDADYIYSVSNGEQTIVELDSWDATEKTPEFVVIWVRAKKDVADAHKVKLINDDGVNTEVGDAQALLPTYSYVHELLISAPDGFQWNDAKVDTLNLGVESVVV